MHGHLGRLALQELSIMGSNYLGRETNGNPVVGRSRLTYEMWISDTYSMDASKELVDTDNSRRLLSLLPNLSTELITEEEDF